MTESEIIVRFRPGVAEDEARRAIEALGGRVRRRMRDDGPQIVTLIVRGPAERIRSATEALRSRSDVDVVESNDPDYRALD